jgi:putative ABC transport system permease protein
MPLRSIFHVALALRRNLMRTLLTTLGMIIGVAAVITIGALGILAGFATEQGITQWLAWPTEVSMPAVTIPFAFASAVGIFFGWYPARKAAGTDPIEALRFE